MSIYHLHIPRTSGVFIRENIINNFSNKNNFVGHRQKLPESFSMFDNISGHFANNPVAESDITFALLRNPVELTFSYVQYMRDRFYPIFTFDELFNKYEREGLITNFSNINTKFLTGFLDSKKYNDNIQDIKRVAENGWYVENYLSNAEFAVSQINSSGILTFIYEDPQKYEKISKIYGKDILGDKVNDSQVIDSKTIKKYKKVISDLNWLDLELYEYFK
jgi:hypothetical protein